MTVALLFRDTMCGRLSLLFVVSDVSLYFHVGSYRSLLDVCEQQSRDLTETRPKAFNKGQSAPAFDVYLRFLYSCDIDFFIC